MKEISCKILTILFKELDKNNLPPEILCQGIPYNLNYLRNENGNIEWDVYCKIMSNTRSLWNDEDYIRLGINLIEWKLHPVLSTMIGLFLNTKEMYRLITSTKRGIGTQYFRCITSTFSEIDKHHLEILVELPAGYQYCKEFFLITKGFFIAAPRLLKFSHSSVIMHETDRGALYKISLPQRNSPFAWFRQLLSLPSSKRAGIREMNETYALLYDRYNQLEESKAHIQKQAKQLETAHSISNIIRSNLDLDFTLNAVAQSMVNVAGFAAVEINVDWKMDRERIKRAVSIGIVPATTTPLKRVLEGQGNSFGEINLWLIPGSSTDDAQHLLDYVISPISIEILNALSFKLVNEYRRKLENKVDEIQRAILEERRRISGELHDDLGTNLSAIALMSGVMNQNLPGDKVGKISVIAQQSLDKINEIVWSLNPKNDNLENLVAYIRKYAVEYFEPTSIKCKVNLPSSIPDFVIKGEHRRNVFYTVKEALHNIIKHAQATETELNFSLKNDVLSIVILDNGIGIPEGELNRFGNGIRNMKSRMEMIDGKFAIENDSGTRITLSLAV